MYSSGFEFCLAGSRGGGAGAFLRPGTPEGGGAKDDAGRPGPRAGGAGLARAEEGVLPSVACGWKRGGGGRCEVERPVLSILKGSDGRGGAVESSPRTSAAV